jgi:hypothetical protein
MTTNSKLIKPKVNEINISQALLGMVWGTWFSLSCVSVLSAHNLRFPNAFIFSDNITITLIKTIISIVVALSILCIAMLLTLYQYIRVRSEENSSTENAPVDKILKSFVVWTLFALMLLMPLASIVLFTDINTYQMVLSGILIAIFIGYIEWERKWMSTHS